MVNAKGFTLIEMMIALFIAALISIALSVVFRLGMNFLARSRSYYSNLQESLAVVGYLRRSVSHAALEKVLGDGAIVLLQAGSKPDGSGSGLVCRDSGDAHWSLASFTVQAKDSKDSTANAPQALPVAPGAQTQAIPDGQQGTTAEQAVLPTAEQLQQAQTHILLTGLDTCSFEYLLSKADPAGQPLPASSASVNAAPPSSYAWLDARTKGKLAAIRISLATADAAFPPIVLAPVK
jgi:prepilin-type N-terminal cleavage/methylation domain-containing protein